MIKKLHSTFFKLSLIASLFFLSQCSYISIIEEEEKEISKGAHKFDKSVFEIKEREKKPDWMEMKGEGIYKVGKPYKVNGIWYFPKEDAKYDEIGVASWYGPEFHQRLTANGEYFDMDLVTAAHKTLPLPSVVRVTNLENGRSLLVRVNDRGPFVNERIIDLSRKAADLLGFIAKGKAKVRVELMPEESMAVASYAQNQFITNIGQVPKLPAVSAGAVTVSQEDMSTSQQFEQSSQESLQSSLLKSEQQEAPQVFVSQPKEDDLAGVVSTLSEKQGVQVVKSSPVQPSQDPRESFEKVSPQNSYGKSYVQVGAFGSKENAEKISKMLASVGSPNIESLERLGQIIYRVRFGPYEDVADAQKVMDKILEIGHGDVQIVVE
jgi:rare lipoprotein A